CQTNPPATPQLYPLSLHDALPISPHHTHYNPAESNSYKPFLYIKNSVLRLFPLEQESKQKAEKRHDDKRPSLSLLIDHCHNARRSEEHTSELQSRFDLVCRLLLAK